MPLTVTVAHPVPGETVHCLNPAELGLNRTVTRTKPGGVMQYETIWVIANSGQLSVTEPQSVPPPEFSRSGRGSGSRGGSRSRGRWS
jgi:hypothetical protein